MTQAFPPHPRVVETMAIMDLALAQYDRYLDAVSKASTTRTDSTKTVAVTLNHHRWLTDIWIAPGTRAVGADVLNNRIREALQSANAAALQTQQTLAGEHQLEFAAIGRSLQELTAKYGDPTAGTGQPPTAPPDPQGDDRW